MGLSIEGPSTLGTCEPCIIGKSVSSPYPNVSRTRARRFLEIVHGDLCEYPVLSAGGRRYMLSLVDDFSGFSVAIFLEKKEETLAALIRQFHKWQFTKDHHVDFLRCDNGGEFSSVGLQYFLDQNNTTIQFTAPYCHGQNGVLVELTRRFEVARGERAMRDET